MSKGLWGWAQSVKMFTSHMNAHQNPCPEHGYPWYPVDSVRRLLSHQCLHTGPTCKVATWAVEAPHGNNKWVNSPQGDLAVDCTQCPNQQRQRPTLSLLWRLSTAGLPRTHPTLEGTELPPHRDKYTLWVLICLPRTQCFCQPCHLGT